MEFWRIKDNLQKPFQHCHHWSDDKWKKSMAKCGGNKKIYQYCTDSSGAILHFRALQGHSGRSPMDPTLQDNVLIPNNIFEYTCHIGCAVSLHSITNSGLIAEGQNSSRDRQTAFFTAVNLMHKSHKDPQELDLAKPRLASYKQKWRRHQDTVYWVDKQLTQRERIEVLSNKIERHHPLRYIPSLLHPESCCDGIWRNHIRESICVT